MILSRNEAWVSDYITEREWGVYPTLHLVAGREFAELLLRYGSVVAKQDANAAEKLSHKATITIAESKYSYKPLQNCFRNRSHQLCSTFSPKYKTPNPDYTSMLYGHLKRAERYTDNVEKCTSLYFTHNLGCYDISLAPSKTSHLRSLETLII